MLDRIARRIPDRWALLALIVALVFLLFHGYGPVLRSPGAVLFTDRGDGLKNYYTFLYHIRYDQDPWEFRGMDHPYGEHVFFTDGHPWLSMLIMGLGHIFPWLPQHGVAILDLLMVLAIPACAIVLFLVLRELSVRHWTAAACAFGITVLAPQVDRMYGHFALSYAVFLPLTWLLLIRAMRSDRWVLWCLLLGISSLWWWGTHAYLGAMVSSFGALYVIGVAAVRWRTGSKRERQRTVAIMVAVCMLPIAIFRGSLMLTDHHTGRTQHPFGFFKCAAEPDDLLLPARPPLRPLLDALTHRGIDLTWEGAAYIGLATILILLAWPLVAWRKRRREIPRVPLPLELRAALWASSVLLLFAFCFPFKDFPGLLRWFPFVEQFRATGRFDQPFYFVIIVIAVVLLDRWSQEWKRTGHHWLAGLSIPVLAMMLTWEGMDAHSQSWIFEEKPNIFSARYLTEEVIGLYARVGSARYQAILPMPYFNFGSERFTRFGTDGIHRSTFALSYHTGLPIMAGELSRVSVPESKKLTELMAPRYYPKPINADLTDDRPFLIVRCDDPLSVYEMDIMRDAVRVDSIPGIGLYTITRAMLFRQVNEERWRAFEERRSTLIARDGFLVSDDKMLFTHLDLDDHTSDITYRGSGASSSPKLGKHDLARMRLTGVRKGTPMIASMWMYNAFPEGLNMDMMLEVEQPVHQAESIMPDHSEVIQGDWSLVELPFTTTCDDEDITLRTVCDGYIDRRVIVDEILVRPAALDVYRVERSTEGREELFYNDHRIPHP